MASFVDSLIYSYLAVREALLMHDAQVAAYEHLAAILRLVRARKIAEWNRDRRANEASMAGENYVL